MAGPDEPDPSTTDLGLTSGQSAALFAAKSNLWRTLDIPTLMQASIEAAVQITGLDTGAIYLLDENVLYLGATTPPLRPDFPDDLRYADARAHPHIMMAVDTESPLTVDDLLNRPLTAEERAVVRARDLRSILYAPLLTGERPLGVFMVASSGRTCEIPDSTRLIVTTLGYSISLALEEAHLFDSLIRRSDKLPEERIRQLQSLASSTSTCDPGVTDAVRGDVQERIARRLALLDIHSELSGTASQTPSDVSFMDVAHDARPFVRRPEAHPLDLGLQAATEYLVDKYGVGPCPSDVCVSAEAQMTDQDTTFLLYETVRDILSAVAERPGARADEIRIRTSPRHMLELSVSAHGCDCPLKPEPHALPGAITVISDRIQRAGGAVDFNCAPRGSATFKAALPHLTFTT